MLTLKMVGNIPEWEGHESAFHVQKQFEIITNMDK